MTDITKPPPLTAKTEPSSLEGVNYPRLVIHYCTGCRWLLRAAWVSQELLTTFSTAIGEVALVPTVGGVFRVELLHLASPSDVHQSGHETEGTKAGEVLESTSALVPSLPETSSSNLKSRSTEFSARVLKTVLWERTSETGFPEIKTLKQKVRDVIDPSRSLGHSESKTEVVKKSDQEAGAANLKAVSKDTQLVSRTTESEKDVRDVGDSCPLE